MGPAGAGSLAEVINTAVRGRDRFADMEAFFEGVGSGDSAGVGAQTARVKEVA